MLGVNEYTSIDDLINLMQVEKLNHNQSSDQSS